MPAAEAGTDSRHPRRTTSDGTRLDVFDNWYPSLPQATRWL